MIDTHLDPDTAPDPYQQPDTHHCNTCQQPIGWATLEPPWTTWRPITLITIRQHTEPATLCGSCLHDIAQALKATRPHHPH